MATVKYPQTEIGDADKVSEQSGNGESNAAHVSLLKYNLYLTAP